MLGIGGIFGRSEYVCLCVYIYMHIYVYTHVCIDEIGMHAFLGGVSVCVDIYIYTYI